MEKPHEYLRIFVIEPCFTNLILNICFKSSETGVFSVRKSYHWCASENLRDTNILVSSEDGT